MEIFSDNPNNFPLHIIDPIIRQMNELLKLDLDTINMHYLSDNEVLSININYLNHDYYTDIITFDLRDEFSQEAEIYISLERIKENALKYKVTDEEELARICIHGLLHLSGIGDKTEKDKKIMTQLEKKYLTELFHVKPK